MVRHFAADGSVKSEWPEGLHASPITRAGKPVMQVQGSNAVLAEIELGEGEQVGESFDRPASDVAAPDSFFGKGLADHLRSAQENANVVTELATHGLAIDHTSLNDALEAIAERSADFIADHPIETALASTQHLVEPAAPTVEQVP